MGVVHSSSSSSASFCPSCCSPPGPLAVCPSAWVRAREEGSALTPSPKSQRWFRSCNQHVAFHTGNWTVKGWQMTLANQSLGLPLERCMQCGCVCVSSRLHVCRQIHCGRRHSWTWRVTWCLVVSKHDATHVVGERSKLFLVHLVQVEGERELGRRLFRNLKRETRQV